MKGRRIRPHSIQLYARVNGVFRSTSVPLGTSEREQRDTLARLRLGLTGQPVAKAFAAEAADYLAMVKGKMPSYTDQVRHIERWVEVFGPRDRKDITASDIALQLQQWKKSGRFDGLGLAPATLNHRRTALMAMYTMLDGKAVPNIVKNVRTYDESASSMARAVPLITIARVLRRLPADSHTRARMRVLMWTGWPAKLLMQVGPDDLDLSRSPARVKLARRSKGRGMPGAWVPVMPRAVVALRQMARLKCWGAFSTSGMHSMFARAVAAENQSRRERTIPELGHLRPYDLKHSFATFAAGIVKDDRALRELIRTNSIERYTQGSVADRLEFAVAQMVKRTPKVAMATPGTDSGSVVYTNTPALDGAAVLRDTNKPRIH